MFQIAREVKSFLAMHVHTIQENVWKIRIRHTHAHTHILEKR